MSGGVEIMTNVVLRWSRIVIIAFAGGVLLLVWVLLARTRLGLFVRAVTQNRQMASALGVRTPKIDMMAFGLGSGIAGLAGCALSQIGNVGPDLGQSYIVDSFMVVVLGGVGQLAGTPANSIEIAIWTAVGGRETLIGPVIGAGVVNLGKSWFTQALPEYWLYVLGLLFILVTLYLPRGIAGLWTRRPS